MKSKFYDLTAVFNKWKTNRKEQMKKECKICSKELRVLKSPGIDPATKKEHGLVCPSCWVDFNGVVGQVLDVPNPFTMPVQIDSRYQE